MSKALRPDYRYSVLIGVPLVIVALAAWYLSAFELQSGTTSMSGSMTPGVPIDTMAAMFASLNSPVVFSFLIVWTVGMVAMMFPAMIPVMSLYSGLVTKQEARPRLLGLVGPPLFLAGYLSTYAVLGILLFGAVYVAFQVGSTIPWLSSYSTYGVALVLLIAGIWQLTPFKERSLSKCVSPLGFFMTKTRRGLSGAFRMGTEHGYYCVACCWLYMLVMLAVAAMSLISMVMLSIMIIAEKAFVGTARWFKLFSAGIFLCLALITIAFPSYVALL
jgi:predicted metal-binding membrane protein